jgi:hypothetical protein
MPTTIALSSEQQGISQDGSRGLTGIFTLTPGTTATAGEAITSELDDHFQSIDSIEPGGVSAVALASYTPVFQFTPGGLLSAHAVTLFWLAVSGDPGALGISNSVDLSEVGTLQIKVTGKPA